MSPFVLVDQTRFVLGSESTRLPLKERRVVSDQEAKWVGLAIQSGSEDATWTTANASWFWFWRRKHREKLPAGSLRTASNGAVLDCGDAEKPLRSSCGVDADAGHGNVVARERKRMSRNRSLCGADMLQITPHRRQVDD